ncbi:phage tail protein [Clostridium sp. LY3-2]|uniref:major tail protein n=1 Tax=Clostridium sp. LY3-2 TaxID=2942482 RepID=UPI0021526957|nr:major tail protein [Clostridium sp. LY3-2]MCR6515804.1 phage tail protein [Clostridium sp. LY3-2]
MAQRKGVCDFTVADIEKDDSGNYSATNLTKLMKAASAKIKLKYTSEFVYFDDIVDEIDQDFEGGEIELEGDYLTAEIVERIRGHKNLNGMSVTNAEDKANDVCILFRSKMTNGKYKFYCFYRVNFGAEEEEDFEGIGKKAKRQNTKIKGTIMARKKDNLVKVDASETEFISGGVTDAADILKAWFTKVPEPSTITVPEKTQK